MIAKQIDQAMRFYDEMVLRIHYTDAKGRKTERIVSPIKWKDSYNGREFIALCFAREEPRNFKVDQISYCETVKAHDVVMPIAIKELRENHELRNQSDPESQETTQETS